MYVCIRICLWVFNKCLIWNVDFTRVYQGNCKVDVTLLIVPFLIFNQSASWDGYTVTLEKACIARLNAQVDSTGWVSEDDVRARLQRPRSREVTVCQADGPPRSYPRSLRAEYAFRLVVSRLGWVTSPERGRSPSTASEIRYTVQHIML